MSGEQLSVPVSELFVASSPVNAVYSVLPTPTSRRMIYGHRGLQQLVSVFELREFLLIEIKWRIVDKYRWSVKYVDSL